MTGHGQTPLLPLLLSAQANALSWLHEMEICVIVNSTALILTASGPLVVVVMVLVTLIFTAAGPFDLARNGR